MTTQPQQSPKALEESQPEPQNISDVNLVELRDAVAEMQDAIDEMLDRIETLSLKEKSHNEEIEEAIEALSTIFKALGSAEKRARIKIVDPRGDYYGVKFE